jgi:hypothetical protein
MDTNQTQDAHIIATHAAMQQRLRFLNAVGRKMGSASSVYAIYVAERRNTLNMLCALNTGGAR